MVMVCGRVALEVRGVSEARAEAEVSARVPVRTLKEPPMILVAGRLAFDYTNAFLIMLNIRVSAAVIPRMQ